MASPAQSADETAAEMTEEESQNPIIRLLLIIRSSFLASIAAGSVLMIVVAIVIEVFSLKRGVVQAMFLVWGISGLLYATGGFLLLRLIGYR